MIAVSIISLVLVLSLIATFSVYASTIQVVNIPEGAFDSNRTHFEPATLEIEKGTTVKWTNGDHTIHTVTSMDPKNSDSDPLLDPLFDSSYMAAGQTWGYTFNDVGTFKYHCLIHDYMTGEVVVSEVSTPIDR